MRLAIVAVIALAGCKRDNPDFCCLTVDDCLALDVTDGPRTCAVGKVCVSNACVEDTSADASLDACGAAGGVIVFETDRFGATEIARVFADGSGFRRLTDNTWRDISPKISPDGRRIAWLGNPTGDFETFVMNVDGSDPRNLSENGEVGTRWSPDSSRILAIGDSSEIVVVPVDGGGGQPLASATSGESPDWSPDGSRVVFGGSELHVIDADGSNLEQITFDKVYGYYRPRWSPIGSVIFTARESSEAPYLQDLYRVSPSGMLLGAVTDHTGCNLEWSTDGTVAAFEYSVNRPYCSGDLVGGEVMVADAVASGVTNLTNNTAEDGHPAWKPDGTALAFRSDRAGDFDIFSMAADGSGVVNLTNDPGDDIAPSWGRCAD
jgi:Tol biopolymer transport system component